jgi:hypothetical protein
MGEEILKAHTDLLKAYNSLSAAYQKLLKSPPTNDIIVAQPIPVPQPVKKHSAEQELFAEWFTACLAIDNGYNTPATDIIVRFKQWLRDQPTRVKGIPRSDFIDLLSANLQTEDKGESFNNIRVTIEGEELSPANRPVLKHLKIAK